MNPLFHGCLKEHGMIAIGKLDLLLIIYTCRDSFTKQTQVYDEQQAHKHGHPTEGNVITST